MQLLKELRLWSTTPSVIRAALQGCMTLTQLRVLALRVAATLGGKAQTVTSPLTFRETAIAACQFLDSAYSRQEIAKLLMRRGLTKKEAYCNLVALRCGLFRQFGLTDDTDVPVSTSVTLDADSTSDDEKFAPRPEEAKNLRQEIDKTRDRFLQSVVVSDQ
jgi:hypothetical protein